MSSPNGRIQAEFGTSEPGNFNSSVLFPSGTLFYRISLDGAPLIGDSRLGLEFQGSGALSSGMILDDSEHRSGSETYTMPFGKTRNIDDAFEEYVFKMEEEEEFPHRKLNVTFRIFNDGVAFRYSIPEQEEIQQFIITDELTRVTLADEATIHAIPLWFGSAYEWYYNTGKFEDFHPWDHLALPMLLGYPGGKWVGITEAGLLDYAGMYLTPSDTQAYTLETSLAPSLKDPSVKVQGQAPFDTPWRVFMIGDSMKVVMDSNIIYDLNEPSKIPDTSWIHPGKIQFPWWNGYVVPKPDPANPPGLNTWTLKHYIDFSAANGIEDHSIDGFDKAWYGGPCDPFQADGITKAIPEINLPEVLSYAKSKGVKTRLWMHSSGLMQHMDALATYEKWGIEGIMVDFLNRDDPEAVRFYSQVLKATAEHHLTLTYHGIFKPTGEARTYPNMLNHEAVLGTEYNKWSDTGSTPEHELNVAYIRALAGPMDVHQGSFRPVSQKNFHQSWIAPQTIGTLARQLALYVVYENHLPMLADYPEAYEAKPEAFRFVKQVPVYWDESHLVAGEVGQDITMARRHGSEWYLGAITDSQSRAMDVALDFLGDGKFVAEIYGDGPDPEGNPSQVIFKTVSVTSSDVLHLQLAPAGGSAVRIHRQ